MECEANPARDLGASRLCEGTIYACFVVCRGSDEHVWSVHVGTQRHLEQRAILRGPWRTDHGIGEPACESLAERGAVEPGRLVGEISALQPAGLQHFLLYEGTNAGGFAGYLDPGPYRECEEPGRCAASDEYRLREAGQGLQRQFGRSFDSGEDCREFVRRIFRQIRSRD